MSGPYYEDFLLAFAIVWIAGAVYTMWKVRVWFGYAEKQDADWLKEVEWRPGEKRLREAVIVLLLWPLIWIQWDRM